MDILEEHEAIKLNDLCNLKSVRDLASLEALLIEILSYEHIFFYACGQYGSPPIIKIGKKLLNQHLDILSKEKNIECTRIYYDGMQKRYFPDCDLRLEDISSKGVSLQQIRFDRRQLEQVQLIPISEKYIIKPELKSAKFLWNGIEYFTFEQLKAIWDFCDYRTLEEVNSRLENKIFFAYSKYRNMLRKYEKKLPVWFKSYDYSMGDYTKRYIHADDFMFFECELQAHEIFLPIRQEAQQPTQNPTPNTSPSEQKATPQAFVEKLREQGVTDSKELTRRVDEVFTGKEHLTHHALGKLLSESSETLAPATYIDRGRKFRGRK